MRATVLCAVVLLTTAAAVPAQWAKHRDPQVPVSRFKYHLGRNGVDAPYSYCQPFGVPLWGNLYTPYKIVRTPRLIVILYEYQTLFRQIFLDGRKTVPDPNPNWNGYSSVPAPTI